MSGNIFINYRRGDDPGFTQALYSRLEQAFPSERLFMDVDNIAPGLDFVQVLNEQVAHCDVLVAVIGKNWLSASDESGERRLDNPEDFVRIEIESALAQKKRVIPVLVNDAKMPRSTELPEPLKPFARCNAVRLTHERFRADMQGLIKAIEQVLAEADEKRRHEQEEKDREERERKKAEEQRLKHEKADERRRFQQTKDEKRERKPETASPGFVGWLAGLPSEISWWPPIGVVLVYVAGWFLPGILSRQGVELGSWALAYGCAGFVGVLAGVYLRRRVLGGAELAVYWFAAVSFFAIAALSVITQLGYAEVINADAYSLAPALITMGTLVAIRRAKIAGLEASVYFIGIAMIAFWVLLPLLASTTAMMEWDASLTGGNGYKVSGFVLAALLAVSALGALAWRRKQLSGPEAAVYLLAAAFALSTAMRLV